MDYRTFEATYFGGSKDAVIAHFGITPHAIKFWKRLGIPKSRHAEIDLWLIQQGKPPIFSSSSPVSRSGEASAPTS